MLRLILQPQQEKVAPDFLLVGRSTARLLRLAAGAESVVQRQRQRNGLVELLDVEHGVGALVSRAQQHGALQSNDDDASANDHFQNLRELAMCWLSCDILDDGPEAVFGKCPDVCFSVES